jgi:hypothetical protein
MRTTILRVAVTLLALASVALAGAGGIRAASPTVGGTLSAVGNTVTVKSNGNVPARITLSAEVVHLSETTFALDSGQSHTVTFAGDPVGKVYAAFAVVTGATSGDTNSLTLAVGLKPYTPPLDLAPYGAALLVFAGLVLALRRWRPWQYRLARRG